jgi:exonuclease VII large subunit
MKLDQQLPMIDQLNKEQDKETRENIKYLQSRIKEIKNSNEQLLKAIKTGGFSNIIHTRIKENEELEIELNRNLNGQLKKQQTASISIDYLTTMLKDARQKIFVYKNELETKKPGQLVC